MALKDKIYPGDTYLVSIEARRPNPDSPHDSRGLPAAVQSGIVTLLDGLSGDFIELGGPGILTDLAEVTAPTGNLPEDSGSIVSYLVAEEFTEVPGDFTLFIQCVYEDMIDGVPIKLTEERKFKVNEFR